MENQKSDNREFEPITDTEKGRLKSRIFSSIEKHKRDRKRLRYAIAAAASIALFFLVAPSFEKEEEVSVMDYVKTLNDQKKATSDKVTLILNNGENVSLEEDDPNIIYSASGKKVRAGASRSLTQNATAENLIYNTLVVPYGKRSKIKLSDGSTVWINSGSRLIYPATFGKTKREVYLEGEAIFDVSHNEALPFIVNSENQVIEVLGTVFNVNNYADEGTAFTVLKSGSVQIRYDQDTSESLRITPGTYASYNKSTKEITSRAVDTERFFSWREGVMIFKNDDLNTIMRTLSRYYNIDISIENEKLSRETFSGHLDLKDNVEKVMETIKKTTNLRFERIGNRMLIKTDENMMN